MPFRNPADFFFLLLLKGDLYFVGFLYSHHMDTIMKDWQRLHAGASPEHQAGALGRRAPALSSCLHAPHACVWSTQRGVCVQEERGLWVGALWGVCQPPGGGEVNFFSHPFFMAFLLSDLQSLNTRLTGRFSFILKHLLGTRCMSLLAWWGSWWRQGWVKVEACCFSSTSNDYLRTLQDDADVLCLFLHWGVQSRWLCCSGIPSQWAQTILFGGSLWVIANPYVPLNN